MNSSFNSKSTLERTFDALLGRELRKLNTHLPKQRRTLKELLGEAAPTIPTIDGSMIVLRKEEIKELAQVVPREYHESLRLPIIVLRRIELGKSVYTVSEDKIEKFTVKRILGKTAAEYHNMYLDDETLFLYRPDVSELLRRFHSLVVIGFGMPKELSDYVPNRV
ncbi:MAG TPA: DUF61 family protein [Candidatus Dormibacteraeota bacterium]|nr:DUF61 family protein [Candidatus Dormibacteraeota bacterium]